MKYPLTPLRILFIFLISLTFFACLSRSGTDVSSWLTHLRNFTLLATSGFFLRQLLRIYIDPKITANFHHRSITLLIIFLLFDPTSPWWIFPLLSIMSEIGQCLLRTTTNPIFNPAALGALLVTFFVSPPDWWGMSFSPRLSIFDIDVSIATFLTLPIASFVAFRYRKFPAVFSTLVFFVFFFALLLHENPIHIIFDGTLFFFTLVMVTEPKTSPISPRQQYIYGAIIGSISAISTYLHAPDALLIALLIGNLFTHHRFFTGIIKEYFSTIRPRKIAHTNT